mgnify:CR=1 FL=1
MVCVLHEEDRWLLVLAVRLEHLLGIGLTRIRLANLSLLIEVRHSSRKAPDASRNAKIS